MDIKLHPDAKKLLDEINSRRRGHIVNAAERVNFLREGGLRRGAERVKDDRRLSRADLDGRGGPI